MAHDPGEDDIGRNAPWRMGRRAFLLGSTAFVAACSSDGASELVSESAEGGEAAGQSVAAAAEAAPVDLTLPPPGSPGLVDEDWWQSRVQDYLGFATQELSPGNPTNVNAHLAREFNDGWDWPSETITPEAFAERFARIDEWQDTRDFTMMYLHFLVGFGTATETTTDGSYGADAPADGLGAIPASLVEAIDARFLENRYRYDDPLPADRIDQLWFWSENHRIILHSLEYLAGQRHPDKVFSVTGLTGAEHLERSRPEIFEWIRERGQLGYFEWHSNVYMAKNVTPLLMLVELADDPEVVNAAAICLDLCLIDMAAHYHRGAYVAPHGRSSKKDNTAASEEDTYEMGKMLFDRTPADYGTTSSTTATYFCMARRYRPPQLMLDIAHDTSAGVVKERHGLYLDPTDPITDNPVAPLGYDFADRKNLPFWWSAGGLGLWQMQPIGMAESTEHRLFETDAFADIKLLRDVQNGDLDRIIEWTHDRYMILNLGFLSEANTYRWRSEAVSLASAVDHRKGEMRDQVNMWQASIGPDARVFTTHPMTEPAESTNWRDDESPGYWTGEASMPRSAQHERTGVHIYSPLYTAETDALLAAVFRYRDYTHAYFPQDHFDQVTQVDHWTIGTKGDGHIALWSWREPAWRVYDPSVTATNGMTEPFDLVADGGADNVWIVEVGATNDPDNPMSFEDFVAAVTANDPTVTGSGTDHTLAMEWTSPSSGLISFGWNDPLIVDGVEEPTSDFPRHESKWGTVDRLEMNHRWQSENSSLGLDFENLTRSLS